MPTTNPDGTKWKNLRSIINIKQEYKERLDKIKLEQGYTKDDELIDALIKLYDVTKTEEENKHEEN